MVSKHIGARTDAPHGRSHLIMLLKFGLIGEMDSVYGGSESYGVSSTR